ncbi:MAG: fibronectin type III domain-containing protein [Saprospiraceae bacterium]|nr:fibronectin type III domain-containing protein [Saprospiraceae bacterium]
MRGETPTQIVAFRYAGNQWIQIPVQIDEMIVKDIQAPYGPNDCPYKSTEPIAWNVLFYADTKTHMGGDTADPKFDNDDELVFMAKDAGELAPASSCPNGVVQSTKCEIKVNDPLDNSTLGYVYVFRQSGGLSQGASKDYVTHNFSYANNYKQAYVHCAKKQAGVNPETTTIRTDNYEIAFIFRWVETVLKIFAGNATGADILDRHQLTINTTGCDQTEEAFSTSEGAIITAIDGPVRAIRSVMGAASGPYLQMTYLFTDCKVDYVMYFRLHPANGFHDLFDFSSAASGMKYHSNQNMGGVTINGSQDAVTTTNPNQWELITGNQGTIVSSFEFETDMSTGTLSQYDAGQVEGGVYAYYDDAGNGTNFKCTGDGQAIGTSGFRLKTQQCTDRRFTFDQYPECMPGRVKTFTQFRTHYILPPNQTTTVASKYGSYAKNPLQGVIKAIGSCSQTSTTCDDGIQNGNETGVDCGGSCSPCSSGCLTPTSLTTTNITTTKAKLNWSAVSGANNYTVQIRAIGASVWTVRSARRNTLSVSKLQPGTTYEWQVRTNCASGSSAFSDIVTFRTTGGSANSNLNIAQSNIEFEQEDSSIHLYPSPASDILNVEATADIIQLSILDLTGRVVKNHSRNTNKCFDLGNRFPSKRTIFCTCSNKNRNNHFTFCKAMIVTLNCRFTAL